jgi:hypothetical protein
MEGMEGARVCACALACSMPLLLLSRKSCSLLGGTAHSCGSARSGTTTCTTGLDVPGVGV